MTIVVIGALRVNVEYAYTHSLWIENTISRFLALKALRKIVPDKCLFFFFFFIFLSVNKVTFHVKLYCLRKKKKKKKKKKFKMVCAVVVNGALRVNRIK